MRKSIILALLLVGMTAMGQSVKLNSNGKGDAVTQVKIMNANQATKSGDKQEMRLLAKVSKQFDAQRLKAQGIVVGSQAGDIVTLRLTPDKVALLDANADILQYSVAFAVAPTMNSTRYDTQTDSVQAGAGLPQAYTGEGVLIGITDWGFDYTHPTTTTTALLTAACYVLGTSSESKALPPRGSTMAIYMTPVTTSCRPSATPSASMVMPPMVPMWRASLPDVVSMATIPARHLTPTCSSHRST